MKNIISENALEFELEPCKQFFAAYDCVHQTTCVDRPPQNGTVEKKHRHLIKMSTALRFQASLPLHY